MDMNDVVTAPARQADASALPNGGLEVVSLAKSYDKRSVLSDVSLSVHRGEVVGDGDVDGTASRRQWI